jgi:hypothetical protein
LIVEVSVEDGLRKGVCTAVLGMGANEGRYALNMFLAEVDMLVEEGKYEALKGLVDAGAAEEECVSCCALAN